MAHANLFVLDNIELPTESAGPRTQYPFEDIAIGQTFFLEGRTAAKFAPYAGKFGRRLGRKFTVRNIFMKRKMVDGKQVGWEPSTKTDPEAVSGCAVQRVADPTPAEVKAGKDQEAKADAAEGKKDGGAEAKAPEAAADKNKGNAGALTSGAGQAAKAAAKK